MTVTGCQNVMTATALDRPKNNKKAEKPIHNDLFEQSTYLFYKGSHPNVTQENMEQHRDVGLHPEIMLFKHLCLFHQNWRRGKSESHFFYYIKQAKNQLSYYFALFNQMNYNLQII